MSLPQRIQQRFREEAVKYQVKRGRDRLGKEQFIELIRQADSPREVRGLWLRYERDNRERDQNMPRGCRIVAREAPCWDRRLLEQVLTAIGQPEDARWGEVALLANNEHLPQELAHQLGQNLFSQLPEPAVRARWDKVSQTTGSDPHYVRINLAKAFRRLARRGCLPEDHPARSWWGEYARNNPKEDFRKAALALDGWTREEVSTRFDKAREKYDDNDQRWYTAHQIRKECKDYLRYFCRNSPPETFLDWWREVLDIFEPAEIADLLEELPAQRVSLLDSDAMAQLLSQTPSHIRQRVLRIIRKVQADQAEQKTPSKNPIR